MRAPEAPLWLTSPLLRHRRARMECAFPQALPRLSLRHAQRRVRINRMDWLGDLIKDIVREWPIVMAAPLAFITTGAAGLILGWSAAWLVLRQRLIHHKELVESYKEKEAAQKKGSPRTKASQTPPQLIFSTRQMLLGIAVIIAAVAIPSILILGQPKPLNTILSRIKVNSLFMFHTPDEPELTRFNVNLANSGSLPANNSYVLLLGKLTKDVLTDSVVNDNIDRLKTQLNDEDKKEHPML
jgi:hypothetical protein